MKIKKNFSLTELIAAIAILVLIVAASFQFFSSTQSVIQLTENNRNTAESARVALDVISRDIESAYFGDGAAPFWHWRPSNPATAGWGQYSNELIAFVSSSPILPNDYCFSSLCEIKYQLFYSVDPHTHTDTEGWLLRSATGDRNDNNIFNNKWNFFNNITASYNDPNSAFTATDSSSDSYQKLIPYVIDFKVSCYDKYDNELPPDNNITISAALSPSAFPYSAEITLTILDSRAWKKWLNLSGAAATAFKNNNAKTYTRTVFISNRGQ